MMRTILTGIIGSVCLLGLAACVVEPVPAPVAVAPAPVVVAPAPVAVVVAPRPRRWRRACPVGFHLGRYGRHCFPNR